jgi:tetratricopeptide (TPR) repeat protein
VTVLDSRVYVYLKMGRVYNALKDYDTALRIDPEVAESRFGQNMAALKQGYRGIGKTMSAAAKIAEAGVAEEIASHGVD